MEELRSEMLEMRDMYMEDDVYQLQELRQQLEQVRAGGENVVNEASSNQSSRSFIDLFDVTFQRTVNVSESTSRSKWQ